MHIEPGVVEGAKLLLSVGTAAVSIGYLLKEAWQNIKRNGSLTFLIKSFIAAACVFCFFEVLPHYPIGVSEVHLILGSTLFLVLGLAPAAVGLTLGLLFQGVFFAPFDLPQYGMNVTTLLIPLFAMAKIAQRIIPDKTAYVDVKYSQALRLSLSYQAGIVCWVAFWAFYGQGFGAENLANVASFGFAYMSVILVEPIADLGILALAKTFAGLERSGLVTRRLYHAAK